MRLRRCKKLEEELKKLKEDFDKLKAKYDDQVRKTNKYRDERNQADNDLNEKIAELADLQDKYAELQKDQEDAYHREYMASTETADQPTLAEQSGYWGQDGLWHSKEEARSESEHHNENSTLTETNDGDKLRSVESQQSSESPTRRLFSTPTPKQKPIPPLLQLSAKSSTATGKTPATESSQNSTISGG